VDAADLARLLADRARPVAVIAGAWLSGPLPSAVMDTWRWKEVADLFALASRRMVPVRTPMRVQPGAIAQVAKCS